MVQPGRGQARRSCVLCTQMRSGSWLLSDLCDQTGLLGRPEEYFRPDFRGHWSEEWGIDLRRSYAEYITSAVRNTATPNGIFGVKMHSYQMDWFLRQLRKTWGTRRDDDDMDLLVRWLPQPTFVHLRRVDVARQAISYYRAVYSDVWFELRDDDPAAAVHNSAGGPAFPEAPDWGEVRYLENGLRSQELIWSELFARTGIRPLELTYEEVTEQPEVAVRRILDVMDVDLPGDFWVQPRLKKQADASTDRWLEEYLRHRDTVTPIAPKPQTVVAAQPAPPARSAPNRGAGTSAPGVFGDRGPRPTELVPADFVEGRASWAELTASLVMSGLSIGAAATLVDSLPGEGALRVPRSPGRDWRRTRTPLPARPIGSAIPAPAAVPAKIVEPVGSAKAHPETRTCILAATPWSGAKRLGRLLEETGSMDAPVEWFDPLQVPGHGRRLRLSVQEPGWPAHYLAAVRQEATSHNVCGISLTWAHQRWLIRMARVALASEKVGRGLDSDVLAAWFSGPRYIWIRARDTQSQALRWYAAAHPEVVGADLSGSSPPAAIDYQEVRWLESVIERQDHGWETFFAIHGVHPLVVHREDVSGAAMETVSSVLGRLELRPVRSVSGSEVADDPVEAMAAQWLDDYRRVRARLGAKVGVRTVRR